MRKSILLLLVVSTSLFTYSQVGNWNTSFSIGYVIGGPAQAIKYKMNKQGYNALVENWLFGGSTQYPVTSKSPAIHFRVFYRQSLKRSLFAVAGQSMKAEVRGYKSGGSGFASIQYQVLQLAAGVQFHFKGKGSSLGVAPSLNRLKYGPPEPNEDASKVKVLPGLLVSGKLPMGKEKKLIGLDFIYDLNLIPPVKMEPVQTSYFSSFDTGSVNMVHGSIGLALTIHTK